MTSLNLIPKWRRERRKLRARRKAWVIAGCVYAGLLSIGYAGWRFAWHDDERDMAATLTIARHDVEEMTHNIALLRGAAGKTRRALAVTEALLGEPDFSVALALAGRLRGDEVVLNRCSLDAATKGATSLPGDPAGPPRFSVQGFGRSQAAVSQFALRLERSGLFQSVSVLKSNREPFLSGEAVAFRLECLLRTDAPESASPEKTTPKPPAGRRVASAASAAAEKARLP